MVGRCVGSPFSILVVFGYDGILVGRLLRHHVLDSGVGQDDIRIALVSNTARPRHPDPGKKIVYNRSL